MELEEITNAVESIIFVTSAPVALPELRRTFDKLWVDLDEPVRNERMQLLQPALEALIERWSKPDAPQGFALTEVAGGWCFRSAPRYADVLRAMRDDRPARLSKAALETLAIIAYQQPITKPEVDHVRGVDCGGTIKALLERNFLRIVGKKEEPGRPLLYGTTKEFLSFFNLAHLSQLPSLREFSELDESSTEELQQHDGTPSLQDLSDSAKQLRLTEEPAVADLEAAVHQLKSTEAHARDAFMEQGIAFAEEKEEPLPIASTPIEEETPPTQH